jgi:hypothetical protein
MLLLLDGAVAEIIAVPILVHNRYLKIKKNSLTFAPVVVSDKKDFGPGVQLQFSF